MPPPKKPPIHVPKKANPSLGYEVLIYLNSFYFGMFACCELSMGLLKAINLSYPNNVLARDSGVVIGLCILETIRIILGRRGSLAEKSWQVILSVFLTVPCFFGVAYILLLQEYKLRLEYVLCTLEIGLYLTEVWYAILFVFSLCRPVTFE
ncbi:transmembrane protein 216 [Ceratitis capitata]|uniref:Transmembrane protein 216 n=1 Tax=Ceratitis capitata TaxID=7213 RepID=W8B6D2_CERCA|nr:transmembrane protein 216 [Ceratitis capitata]